MTNIHNDWYTENNTKTFPVSWKGNTFRADNLNFFCVKIGVCSEAKEFCRESLAILL